MIYAAIVQGGGGRNLIIEMPTLANAKPNIQSEAGSYTGGLKGCNWQAVELYGGGECYRPSCIRWLVTIVFLRPVPRVRAQTPNVWVAGAVRA